MKRISLFEFEDWNKLPRPIRDGATRLIVVFHKMMGTASVLSRLLTQVQEHYSFEQIVDLGSGSGGPMPEALEQMNQNDGTPLKLLLTDLHPNHEIIQITKSLGNPNIDYLEDSLNAADAKSLPSGLKTMVCSFHHMEPELAKKILNTAQKAGQPLLIYELAENKIPTLLWWLLLPISLFILLFMSLFMTPFVRPLTWKQLVLTYLIPVIPLVYAWDGQASLVRTYTFEDIQSLIENKTDNRYTWTMDVAKNSKGKNRGYFVMGIPIPGKGQ